ncbi:hypothetical protein [Candidatus Uabimicrobium sp. HlEnr_7]|uniref:hypothetical protein n=1 Tax=Candidatus Uabimicrobium helgolandensis TaxID=3095367 RepID=UPI003556C7DC
MKKFLIVLVMFCYTAIFANVLEKAKILEAVPNDAWVAVVANNVNDLTLRLGKEDILGKYSEMYDQVVNQVTSMTGANLLSPEGLLEKGIDVSKPCGFVLFDGVKEYFAFTATLSDSETFRNFVIEMSEKQNVALEIEKIGDASIIYPKKDQFDAAVILRGDQLIFFIADHYRYRTSALDFVRGLTAVKVEDSLAKDSVFQESTASLNFGKDLGAYINIQVMLKHGPLGRNEQLIEQMSGNPALAIGAEVHNSSLQFKSFFHMSERAVLGTYLQSSHVPHLLFALTDSPLVYLSYALDIPSLVESLSSFAPPGQMEQVDAEFQGMLQMSFSELVSLFNGELGFAVTGQMNTENLTPQALQQLDASIAIGITNQQKVQDLLTKVVEMQMIPMPVENNNGVFQIQVPEWKTVTITVTENHIVISSSKSVVENLKSGANNQVANQLVQLTSPMAVFSMDMRSLGYFILMQSMHGKEAVGSSKIGKSSSTITSSYDENVPFSEKYLAKKAEIDALSVAEEKALQALEEKRDEALEALANEEEKQREKNQHQIQNLVMQIINRLGNLTITSQKTSKGIVTSGGLFMRAGSKQFVIQLVDGVAEMNSLDQLRRQQRRSYWQKRNEIDDNFNQNHEATRKEFNAKENALRAELSEIRQRDIDAHNNKQKEDK